MAETIRNLTNLKTLHLNLSKAMMKLIDEKELYGMGLDEDDDEVEKAKTSPPKRKTKKKIAWKVNPRAYQLLFTKISELRNIENLSLKMWKTNLNDQCLFTLS